MSALGAVRVTVTGRVQGVGFRYATLQEARQRGLSGWVRNLADGRVEVFAQGPEASIHGLLAWLGSGPRFASVAAIDVAAVEPEHGLLTFSIRF